MRNLLSVILVVTLSASPARADLLDCLEPDIREALLHRGYSSAPTFTKEIPESFPDFTHPEGFVLIGSSAVSNSVSLAFKTKIDPVEAEGKMAEALEDAGFERQEKFVRSSQGFQTQVNRPMSLSLCGDDEHSSIHISTRRGVDKTYVRLTSSIVKPGSGQLGCRELQNHAKRTVRRFMPDLILPSGRTEGRSSSGGGGNDNATTKIRFRTDYSVPELLTFFKSQLSDQDWQHGGDWVSEIGEGSVWSSKRESIRLSGNLQVVRHAGSEYSATFSIWQFN